MSRKRTSGSEASSAASTSAPLRHSPATANSGNAARSCLTPRRAAGSSSAINAVHLPGFIFCCGTYLAVGHTQRRDCTAFGASRDYERCALTVKRTQTFARVLDAVTGGWRKLRIDSHAVVNHGQLQKLANAFSGDD